MSKYIAILYSNYVNLQNMDAKANTAFEGTVSACCDVCILGLSQNCMVKMHNGALL